MKKIFVLVLVMLSLVPAAMAEGWTWTSSDESVVHVWPDGSLVVRGVGTAALTGTAQDESGNTVTISITVPEVYAAASSEMPYIGNGNTKKFHRFNCASVNDIKAGNKVSIETREEAIEQGYAPCGRCDP
jgi:hypothetical protein